MNAADFDTQFNRLTAHFHLPADESRDLIGVEWFKAVEHYHVDALEHGVTEMIRTAQDRFWPPLGKLLSAIRSKFDKYERSGKCDTCHGSGWLESAPFKSNGMIYEGVCIRCPDCGIPAPVYTAPNRHGLTASEYAEWKRGDHVKQYMPVEQQAKARPAGEVTEMKAAMERLRIKLFGTHGITEDVA